MSEEKILLSLQKEIDSLKEQRKIDESEYKAQMEVNGQHKKELYGMIEQSKQEQIKLTEEWELLKETQAKHLDRVEKLQKQGDEVIEYIAKQGDILAKLRE